MLPKAKGKAKVTQKESKESYSQDSTKILSWLELVQTDDRASSSSNKTKKSSQKVSSETTNVSPLAQKSYQKVSVETTDMLPLIGMEEIARTNALVLANIFSQNKELVVPKAPQKLAKVFPNKEVVVSETPQKISARYFEKPKEIWEFITPVEIEFLSENPWEIAKKMFSKDFFFVPRDLRKK